MDNGTRRRNHRPPVSSPAARLAARFLAFLRGISVTQESVQPVEKFPCIAW